MFSQPGSIEAGECGYRDNTPPHACHTQAVTVAIPLGTKEGLTLQCRDTARTAWPARHRDILHGVALLDDAVPAAGDAEGGDRKAALAEPRVTAQAHVIGVAALCRGVAEARRAAGAAAVVCDTRAEAVGEAR